MVQREKGGQAVVLKKSKGDTDMTREELKAKLDELKWMEENTPDVFKKLDKEFWVITALKDLYDMCKDYDQAGDPDFNGQSYIDTTKVIKVNTYIPQYWLEFYKIDCTTFSGLFIAADGVLISKELMDSYFNKRLDNPGKFLIDPIRDLGLRDDIIWQTVRRLDNGCGFALKESGICPEWISSYNYWEYVEL